MAFLNIIVPSAASKPQTWSGCMCVITMASTALGSTPAAARFRAKRPKVGANTFDAPVSTRISFSPVLMSHSFDRGRDTHLGQERGLKQFFRTRLVSTEQCDLKREIAVAEHRDLERADLMTVDAGSLHACKWRSHTNPPLLFESENPARCLSLVLATLDRPRFRGNSGHRSRCNVRFWHKADIPTRSTNVRFWG